MTTYTGSVCTHTRGQWQNKYQRKQSYEFRYEFKLPLPYPSIQHMNSDKHFHSFWIFFFVHPIKFKTTASFHLCISSMITNGVIESMKKKWEKQCHASWILKRCIDKQRNHWIIFYFIVTKTRCSTTHVSLYLE